MPTQNVRLVKYVFLDVVVYTKRSTEAQSYIIKSLNYIVKGAVNRYHISSESVIYIPTGDGMCIALIEADLAYDIHVTLAKEILRRIYVHNSKVQTSWKRFEVRIGINQSDNILIKDINDRANVAGAGVNNSRRIMDLADARQILVSSTVYESLHHHKDYLHAFSNEFSMKVKHGLVLKMHQFVQKGITGLNVDTPSSFVSKAEPEPKLTKLAAYYFAHAIKNEKFILNKARENTYYNNWLKLLLWFLAKDSEKASETKPYDIYVSRIMPDTGSNTIDGQFEWFFNKILADVAIDLSYVVVENAVPPPFRYNCFARMGDYLIVNSNGKEKLKRDWPEIWDEFGLGELSDE